MEKVDPESPSFGEVPGTDAYNRRLADATPDIILKTPEPGKRLSYQDEPGHRRTLSGNIIPETIVTRVDDQPAYGEIQGTEAAEMRRKDASPDKFQIRGDVGGESS